MDVIFDRVVHDLRHELLRNLVINFHEIERITQVWSYNIISMLLKFASSMKICKFIIYEAHKILWKFKKLSKL